MARLYGLHAVKSRLARRQGLRRLLVKAGPQSARLREAVRLAEAQGCPVEALAPAELSAQLGLEAGRHQGLALDAEPPPPLTERQLLALAEAQPSPLLLALDGVTDPGNLGACLRSAAALGVDAAILPKDKTAPLNAVAAKAASGALDFLPVAQVANLARVLQRLKAAGVWLVGAALEAETALPALDLRGGLCLALGAEGAGLRRRTRETCDHLAAIPLAGGAGLPLNVSVATGVCLYEAQRQRMPCTPGKPSQP